MSVIITNLDLVAMLRRMAEQAITLRDQLNQLDAALGDGDTGITVAKAAGGLLDYLNANAPGEDLGKYLAAAGMAVNRVASSTLGTLVATAFMRAGKAAQGKSTLDQAVLAQMVQAANLGIQERGKAKPGDKTLVDALHPAAEAFVAATEKGQSLDAALAAMVEAARRGRDAAIGLRSQIGRAAWVGERTENQPDPGSVLVVHLLETVAGLEHTAPGSTLG
jgi:dihydroxyacetone kinase